MNFIEAALLIQGSACVYSKKVGPVPADLGASSLGHHGPYWHLTRFLIHINTRELM